MELLHHLCVPHSDLERLRVIDERLRLISEENQSGFQVSHLWVSRLAVRTLQGVCINYPNSGVMVTKEETKSLQHLLFPGGHPSKYWAGPIRSDVNWCIQCGMVVGLVYLP